MAPDTNDTSTDIDTKQVALDGGEPRDADDTRPGSDVRDNAIAELHDAEVGVVVAARRVDEDDPDMPDPDDPAVEDRRDPDVEDEVMVNMTVATFALDDLDDHDAEHMMHHVTDAVGELMPGPQAIPIAALGGDDGMPGMDDLVDALGGAPDAADDEDDDPDDAAMYQ